MDKFEAGTAARPAAVAPEEWAVRVDLAACYRLIAHFGWDDLVLTHNSARVPGREDQFLINPMGLMFNEITASNLLKVDLEGNLVEPSEYEPIYAGFVIHSAIYLGRADVQCVIHTHTEADIAVGALEDGLLPLSQWAMRFYNRLGYHDYEVSRSTSTSASGCRRALATIRSWCCATTACWQRGATWRRRSRRPIISSAPPKLS